MNIVKIAAICIISAVLCKLFSGKSSEYGLYIKIASAAMITSVAIICVSPVIESVNKIFLRTGADSEYLNILFKSLGICYVSQLAADICRDSGEAALATQAELAGKIALIITALPLVDELTGLVTKLSGY